MLVKIHTTHTAVFGAVLSLIREQRKIKQGSFAKKIQMSSPSISKIEKGDTPLSYENLIKCSQILNLKTSFLLETCEKVEEALRERGIRILNMYPEEAQQEEVMPKDTMIMSMFGKILKDYIKHSKIYELLKDLPPEEV